MNTAADREQAPAAGLAFDGSAGLERLASQFRPRLGQPMPAREWRAESTVALIFIIAAVPLAVWLPGHGSHSPWVALLFVALFALTSRIEFDVSTGYDRRRRSS